MKIIAGIYKRKKYATFLKYRGTKMATIEIKEPNKKPYECNVYLSSIAKIPKNPSSSSSAATATTKKATNNIVLTREEHEELVNEVKDLTKRLGNLEIALRDLGRRK